MASRRNAWLALVLMMSGAARAAEPLALVATELASGNYAAALRTLDGLPRTVAATVDARFLRGTALMGSGRLDEAAILFEALVVEKPQLPEAYNNLAVVYVRQGRLDEAKQVLERALATDPRYATVYENLSAIYVEMARSSYAKALRMDPAAQGPRLAVLTALPVQPEPVSVPVSKPELTPPPLVVAAAEPQRSVQAPEPVPAPAVIESVSPQKAAPVEPVPVPVPAAVPVPDEPAPTPAVETAEPPLAVATLTAEPAPVAESAVAGVPEHLRLAVLNAVAGWARAWSEQNPDKYLAYYAADYAPEDMTRSAWEDERRSRLTRPAWIKVTLEEQEVVVEAEDAVVVTLKQRYLASNYRDTSLKRLTLALRDGNWVITSEASLKVRR